MSMVEEIIQTGDTKTFYDFKKMQKYINTILGFNQREYGKILYPNSGSFFDWHNSKNYGEYDFEGKYKNVSKSWCEEYKQDIKNGLWKETPNMDFYTWQLENCFDNNTFPMPLNYTFLNIGLEIVAEEAQWIQDIQKVWYETFKDLANDNNEIYIFVTDEQTSIN